MVSNKVCPTCGSPLMKIDHYGEVLIGCVHCNYWGRPGDKRPILELLEDDLEALRARVRQEHPPQLAGREKQKAPAKVDRPGLP
jgi:uncharacterized Zn finger protein (UPF0148 family)